MSAPRKLPRPVREAIQSALRSLDEDGDASDDVKAHLREMRIFLDSWVRPKLRNVLDWDRGALVLTRQTKHLWQGARRG